MGPREKHLLFIWWKFITRLFFNFLSIALSGSFPTLIYSTKVKGMLGIGSISKKVKKLSPREYFKQFPLHVWGPHLIRFCSIFKVKLNNYYTKIIIQQNLKKLKQTLFIGIQFTVCKLLKSKIKLNLKKSEWWLLDNDLNKLIKLSVNSKMALCSTFVPSPPNPVTSQSGFQMFFIPKSLLLHI